MPSLGYLYDHPSNLASIASPNKWPLALLADATITIPPDYLDPNLRPTALDQDGIGACVAFAAATIKQSEDKKDWGEFLYGSGVWTASPASTGAFLSYWYLKHGTPDGSFPGDGAPTVEGSWPDAVWQMALKYGIVDLHGNPHKISAYYGGSLGSDADFLTVQQVIMAHGPVNVATPWPSNWMASPPAPAFQLPPPSTSIAGGHSWTIAGWNTTRYGRLMGIGVNSWGPDWSNPKGMFMFDPAWLYSGTLGPAPVWKPIDLPDAPKPPAPENQMFPALANTPSTPWDQLIDVPIGTDLTTADGRLVPLKSGGIGLWSPFATSATSRAVWFSTGGVTQLGTVSTYANARARLSCPDETKVYDEAVNDSIAAITKLIK